MTIWELLDGLEAELGRLRSRLAELESQVSANGQLQFTLTPAATTKNGSKRKASAKKKPRPKSSPKKSHKSKANPQPDLLLQEAKSEGTKEEPRLLGKRQALGKSLLQLRKASTARLQPVEENQN